MFIINTNELILIIKAINFELRHCHPSLLTRRHRLSDIQAMKANIDTEPVNPQNVMELFRMKEIALQKKLKDPNYQIEEEQSGMVY